VTAHLALRTCEEGSVFVGRTPHKNIALFGFYCPFCLLFLDSRDNKFQKKGSKSARWKWSASLFEIGFNAIFFWEKKKILTTQMKILLNF
jgi:hypothetical protein